MQVGRSHCKVPTVTGAAKVVGRAVSTESSRPAGLLRGETIGLSDGLPQAALTQVLVSEGHSATGLAGLLTLVTSTEGRARRIFSQATLPGV